MGHWQDFWKPVCAGTPMDARHAIPSVIWMVGTSRRTGGSRGLERNSCELRKIGRAARDVSRWLRIRRSITKYRNECTKRWDLRLWSAAYDSRRVREDGSWSRGVRKSNQLPICGRPWYEPDNGAARLLQVMYNFGRGFLLLSWLKKQ